MQIKKKLSKFFKKSFPKKTRAIAIDIFIVFVSAFLIHTFVINTSIVYGESMCDTLNLYKNICQKDVKDFLIINKFMYYFSEPKRGDIIVFKKDGIKEQYLIKRIIGLPEDTVIIKNGSIFIKNEKYPYGMLLDESSYLQGNKLKSTRSLIEGFNEFKVPEDSYLVLGDNRINSNDSRNFFGGENIETVSEFVFQNEIVGKSWFIIWPLDNIKYIKFPSYNI